MATQALFASDSVESYGMDNTTTDCARAGETASVILPVDQNTANMIKNAIPLSIRKFSLCVALILHFNITCIICSILCATVS